MAASPPLTIDLSRRHDGDPGVALVAADRPLTSAEQAQVDQAVRTVNAMLLQKNLEVAAELHRYVIGEFFAGSWQAWADNRPGFTPAYDAFAGHGGLRVGKEMLRELIRVGEQLIRMPGRLAGELTVAHHRALLPVASEEGRVQLAERALRDQLSAKQLADLVRQLHPPPARSPGRPAQPRSYRKLADAFKAVRAVDPARVAAEAAGYTPHQRGVVADRAKAIKALAEAVIAVLEADGAPGGGLGSSE